MKPIYSEYITKIEGHGLLYFDFAKNKANFEVAEGERLFEQLVLGRTPEEIPFLVARICGVCPTAHHLAAIKAMEKIFKIEPTETTVLLRKLLIVAQIIQSHNLHLYFLVLPDYLNLKAGQILANSYPDEFHIAINLKRMADKILETVGGRSIHPVNPVIDGFSKSVTHHQLSELQFDLENVVDDAKYTIDLFSKIKFPIIKNPTQYLALKSKDEYEVYDGPVTSNKNIDFDANSYQSEFTEEIFKNSKAKLAYWRKNPVMTGAIARLNLGYQFLNPQARAKLDALDFQIGSFNTFDNILAQTIEILHLIEEAIKLTSILQKKKLNIEPEPYKTRESHGVAAIEAPRGTLYHYYEVGANGKIAKADIITPTNQMLTNIEKDVEILVADIKKSKSNAKPEEIKAQIETLIRAYDPCLTCSAH
ncbi:MAG TPA: Ni/Fe hydrogenase subunit alpha [Patescibacteria group bacterium]|nr:Ni/Fe hydrogenase subunit alpha [Patescibacteria group bacterium]